MSRLYRTCTHRQLQNFLKWVRLYLSTESVFRMKHVGVKTFLFFNLHMKKAAIFLSQQKNGCIIEAARGNELRGLLFAPQFQDFSKIP